MPTAFTILPQILGRRYIRHSNSNSGRKGSELDQNDLEEISIAIRYFQESEVLVHCIPTAIYLGFGRLITILMEIVGCTDTNKLLYLGTYLTDFNFL